MSLPANDACRLALEEDRERLLALLSIAARRSIMTKDTLRHIEAASRVWDSGDKALANLRLAFARLPRLDGAADAYRLWLAETLLDDGFLPYKLMKELRLDPAALDLLKYDENQPRVPAGNGRESGRWGPGGGGTSAAPISLILTELRFLRRGSSRNLQPRHSPP